MKNFKQQFIANKLEHELGIKNGRIVIDEASCDGCGTCVEVCPQAAIKIRALSKDEVRNLQFKGRLKVMIKGNNKAFIDAEICTSCGLCMKQCHEFAIHKVNRTPVNR